jgi:chemotaxis-related protein WspB
MLFLLFQLGADRYALEASRVVEVVPLLALKQLPQAPPGVAGIFNYRGRPVPAVDLSALTLGRPAGERLSTRIIIINYAGPSGANHLLGLIAERATDTLRKDIEAFVDPGVKLRSSPFLGPILMDANGAIQWVREQYLLPETVGKHLFSEPLALGQGAA